MSPGSKSKYPTKLRNHVRNTANENATKSQRDWCVKLLGDEQRVQNGNIESGGGKKRKTRRQKKSKNKKRKCIL